VRLLQGEPAVLLELPLRLPDLPDLHGREPLGHDLQQPDLDLPGLRYGPVVLDRIYPHGMEVRDSSPPSARSATGPAASRVGPLDLQLTSPIVCSIHRLPELEPSSGGTVRQASTQLTIDGQQIEADAGDTILGACEANGIHIPTVCNHGNVEPGGSSWMSVVDVRGVG
jgi:hypothetical protein